MAYCRNCGGEVHEDAVLCTKCGVLIDGRIRGKSIVKGDDGGIHQQASYWLFFTAAISFFISLSCVILMIESYDFSVVWFVFSLITLGTLIAAYVTSFELVARGIVKKIYNYNMLMLMICSAIYSIAVILVVA